MIYQICQNGFSLHFFGNSRVLRRDDYLPFHSWIRLLADVGWRFSVWSCRGSLSSRCCRAPTWRSWSGGPGAWSELNPSYVLKGWRQTDSGSGNDVDTKKLLIVVKWVRAGGAPVTRGVTRDLVTDIAVRTRTHGGLFDPHCRGLFWHPGAIDNVGPHTHVCPPSHHHCWVTPRSDVTNDP